MAKRLFRTSRSYLRFLNLHRLTSVVFCARGYRHGRLRCSHSDGLYSQLPAHPGCRSDCAFGARSVGNRGATAVCSAVVLANNVRRPTGPWLGPPALLPESHRGRRLREDSQPGPASRRGAYVCPRPNESVFHNDPEEPFVVEASQIRAYGLSVTDHGLTGRKRSSESLEPAIDVHVIQPPAHRSASGPTKPVPSQKPHSVCCAGCGRPLPGPPASANPFPEVEDRCSRDGLGHSFQEHREQSGR